MGFVWPALKLRMILDTYIEGVISKFNSLHQTPVRGYAAQDQAGICQRLPVIIIKLSLIAQGKAPRRRVPPLSISSL